MTNKLTARSDEESMKIMLCLCLKKGEIVNDDCVGNVLHLP